MNKSILQRALGKLAHNSFPGHKGNPGHVGGSVARGAGGGGAFTKGDQVKIKKEFQDPGDEGITWTVLGDEEKGRVDIQANKIFGDWKIKPTHTVDNSLW
jgi:hypothetical protein